MRIAIPVSEANGSVAEEFSPAGLFALYDVHDETRAVAYIGRQSLAEPGCGRTPGFLREQGVEVVMAHGISENAVSHLREAGIVAIKDAPVLSTDALIAHLVSGTLQATPPDAAMQERTDGELRRRRMRALLPRARARTCRHQFCHRVQRQRLQ